MAQGKSGGGNTGKSGGASKGGAGSPGKGRAPNGFPGGNWPSTKSNVISGFNRGNGQPKS